MVWVIGAALRDVGLVPRRRVLAPRIFDFLAFIESVFPDLWRRGGNQRGVFAFGLPMRLTQRHEECSLIRRIKIRYFE
jgi:hypothetical protein